MASRSSLIILLLSGLAFGQLSDILRPTKDVDPGGASYGCLVTGNQASAAMPKSYDSAGLATFGSLLAIGDDSSGHNKTRLFSNWAATTNLYTALTLNVNASLGVDSPGVACFKYSLDGGVTYTTGKCSSVTVGQQAYQFTLDPKQDLTKLRIGACAYGGKGNARAEVDPGDAAVTIYDIWTIGSNPAPATGNGSTAGQAHRGIVVSN